MSNGQMITKEISSNTIFDDIFRIIAEIIEQFQIIINSTFDFQMDKNSATGFLYLK